MRTLPVPVILLLILCFTPALQAAEPTPAPVITRQVIKGENRGGDWEIAWPEFSGGPVDWKPLNERFAADARQQDKEFPTEALENVAEVPPDVWIRCNLTVDYTLETNETGLISLVLSTYRFMGGAHGLTSNEAFIIDPATGKHLSFDELFAPGQKEKILASIDQRIKDSAKLPEDHPENGMYFPEASASAGNPIFFLRGDQLIVQYPSYEIAPYAAGLPEFAFPLNDLEFRK